MELYFISNGGASIYFLFLYLFFTLVQIEVIGGSLPFSVLAYAKRSNEHKLKEVMEAEHQRVSPELH